MTEIGHVTRYTDTSKWPNSKVKYNWAILKSVCISCPVTFLCHSPFWAIFGPKSTGPSRNQKLPVYLDTFGQTETICRQEEKMAAEIDRKERAERLKKLLNEENEKYKEELKAIDNEHLLVEIVKKSLF